jgi:arylsulfatase A-like enzyme
MTQDAPKSNDILSRLARLALFIGSAELVIARLSSNIQSWSDILFSVCGLGLLAVLCWLPALGLRKWARLANAAAVLAPAPMASLIVFGLCFGLGTKVAAALGILAGIFTAACSLASHTKKSEALLFGGVALILTGALAIGWSQTALVPPTPIWLTTICLWLLFAAGSTHRYTVGFVPLLALSIARYPVALPETNWAPAKSEAAGPDIVYLTIDTLRADNGEDMAVYQQLAKQGTRFEYVQTTAPWTLPSMASLHTGLLTDGHGAGTREDNSKAAIKEAVPTLAERLKERNYATAAVVASNPWLGERFGFNRGFDVFDHAEELAHYALPTGTNSYSTARPIIARLAMAARIGRQASLRPSADIIDRALGIVEQRPADQPLFLWLHFMDCHTPYQHTYQMDLPFFVRNDISTGDPFQKFTSDEDNEILRSAYIHEVAVLDKELQRLLKELGPPTERGRVVVFTSDHGEEFREHGNGGHGGGFWDEIITVPTVISGLGETNRVVSKPIHHVDIPATVLAAAGATFEELPGRDLRDDIEVQVQLTEQAMRRLEHGWSHAVLDWPQKLIMKVDGTPHLFDIGQDPREQRNHATESPAIVERLQAATPGPTVAGGDAPEIDDIQGALKVLGYVD